METSKVELLWWNQDSAVLELLNRVQALASALGLLDDSSRNLGLEQVIQQGPLLADITCEEYILTDAGSI